MSFREHFRRVADKAAKIVGRLSQLIMLNLGGPKEICRRTLMGVAVSVLLSGAPVWADAMSVPYRWRKFIAE